MSRSAPDRAAQRAVLDRVGSLEREQAVLHARQARARAELAGLFGADQGVYAELAGTARIGQDRAAGQLTRAERLVEHFPIALGLLELGVMRVGTVQIVLELTKNARPEVQQLLDERLSERICPMDAVDVRRLVARTLLEVEGELDEAAQRERHERARANRGVWAFPVEDGMARIGAELDHEIPYAEGGQTALWNLKHRSPRCHHCKHHGWVVEHGHTTGVSEWTSPAGSHFTRESPWQPPTQLPEELQLPGPRLVQPHDPAPDREDNDDRPLWRDPTPPTPRQDPTPKPPTSSWDDGPPPF